MVTHNSGKSLIIYLLARYYDLPTLIIVPTINLVNQLASDFSDYNFDSDTNVYRIYDGATKETDKQITISTWQSIKDMPREFFDKFKVVIGDEAHTFNAKSLKRIMENLVDCKYRTGLTGSLDGEEVHKLVLEGVFGPIARITSTERLMKEGFIAELLIKVITLSYPLETKKALRKMGDYQTEMSFLISHKKRNNFIKNLAISLEGNTLLLFQFVDKHGKELNEIIKDSTNRPIFYVHGKTDADEREEVRKIVEKETNAIIIASYGVFSTGTNIVNLHNLIFASPFKTKIRTLQSIGRILRKSDSKDKARLYDIADDLSYDGQSNHTLNHLFKRIKTYNEEKFTVKYYNVSLYEK